MFQITKDLYSTLVAVIGNNSNYEIVSYVLDVINALFTKFPEQANLALLPFENYLPFVLAMEIQNSDVQIKLINTIYKLSTIIKTQQKPFDIFSYLMILAYNKETDNQLSVIETTLNTMIDMKTHKVQFQGFLPFFVSSILQLSDPEDKKVTIQIYQKFVKELKCEDDSLRKFSDVQNWFFWLLKLCLFFYDPTCDTEEIAELPDVSEGLEYSLKSAADSCNSVIELLSIIDSKRYTRTRLQRILLYAIIGITKKDMQLSQNIIPYIRVLGFNNKGRDIISEISNRSPKLELVTSVKKFMDSSNNKNLKHIMEKDIWSTNIYTLGYEYESKSNLDFTKKLITY